MDFTNGRMRTKLDGGSLVDVDEITEQDGQDFTRYFHSFIANRTVELTIPGAEDHIPGAEGQGAEGQVSKTYMGSVSN